MIQIEIYEEFEKWLDDILENSDIPENTAAFCFNLYEESAEEHLYSIQPAAAGDYDPDDKEGNWACDELWSSEENVFTVDTSDEESTEKDHAFELFKEMCEEYLENGKYKNILLDSQAVAIGFVDGELSLVFKAEKE